MGDEVPARSMWEVVERVHSAPVYLAPETREAAARAGVKGFWMGYFATRAAPMGSVGPEVVEAIFFYFAPARVRRAIPDAWHLSSPAALLEARYQGVDAALRRLLGEELLATPQLAEAADLAQEAARRGVAMGKPLYAGWSALPWPEPAHLRLWHAATLLREHRSGAHLVALAAAGLDGCESVVSHVAVDGAPREWIQGESGWSPEEQAVAEDRLRQRGWLDGAGRITASGRAGRLAVEQLTDELDGVGWAALGAEGCQRLTTLLEPVIARFEPDDQLDWQQIYGPNVA